MAIEGPIKELSLMDLFQLLAMSRKSGVLTLDSAHDVGQVFFSNGNIIRATLQQSHERLGQIMLKSGKVTTPQLERILKDQSTAKERKRFGALATESGFVTKPAVKKALKTQVEEVVFAIMGWQDGYFRFEETNGPRSIPSFPTWIWCFRFPRAANWPPASLTSSPKSG
ncbi:DUF4388 domain-containing protein [candidate division TA06 bacterium]|uniref:DUF4388 domain-containing protein n=1 Tax=candidate division TA06 bacterium TaxID=2250710 RepID=A0A933I973_UNCT6|nr:DUF4388 domain-containing protein [candidate division TA06 bacterium]